MKPLSADDYSASFRLIADGFDRLRIAMCSAGEAAALLGQAMERFINDSLARLTPEQRTRYHSLVESGAYKLDALTEVTSGRPKGKKR